MYINKREILETDTACGIYPCKARLVNISSLSSHADNGREMMVAEFMVWHGQGWYLLDLVSHLVVT
jgi:hypothetical protein